MLVKRDMKALLILVTLLWSTSATWAAEIRGYYTAVGKTPTPHSVEKIRFEEFINFGCPHCNSLRQASQQMREEYADRVNFIDIPIAFRGQDDSPIRLYYVAERMGKGEMVKNELFKTRFEYDVNVFDPGIVNYLAKSLGIDKEYQAQGRQPWVDAKLAEAERKTQQYGLTGTPTVVIEESLKMDIGRYGTMANFASSVPETFADLLRKQ